MYRPKIKITRKPVDLFIEGLGLAAVVVMISLPLAYYQGLPEMIPGHFNAGGEPDDLSNKTSIWILPAAGLILYAGMTILNKYPHIFNFPVEITKENAYRQYKIATRAVRMLNTAIACGFCYLVYATIQTATGNQYGLGKYFIPVFLIVVSGPVVYLIYGSIKAK